MSDDLDRPWIEFDSGLILTASRGNWQIRKRGEDQDEQPGDEDFSFSDFEVVGYYTDLTNLLERVMHLSLQEERARTLDELQENLMEIRDEIVQALKGEL